MAAAAHHYDAATGTHDTVPSAGTAAPPSTSALPHTVHHSTLPGAPQPLFPPSGFTEPDRRSVRAAQGTCQPPAQPPPHLLMSTCPPPLPAPLPFYQMPVAFQVPSTATVGGINYGPPPSRGACSRRRGPGRVSPQSAPRHQQPPCVSGLPHAAPATAAPSVVEYKVVQREQVRLSSCCECPPGQAARR